MRSDHGQLDEGRVRRAERGGGQRVRHSSDRYPDEKSQKARPHGRVEGRRESDPRGAIPRDSEKGDRPSHTYDYLMNVAAVGRVLGVSAKTVRRLTASQQLPMVRLTGRLIRFRASDVQAYIASLDSQGPGQPPTLSSQPERRLSRVRAARQAPFRLPSNWPKREKAC
jgi:excisionase family DNA binding protein